MVNNIFIKIVHFFCCWKVGHYIIFVNMREYVYIYRFVVAKKDNYRQVKCPLTEEE